MELTPALMAALFERHPCAVLVIDAAGRVARANVAAAWLERDGSFPEFGALTGLALPHADGGRSQASSGWTRRLRVQAADGGWRQVDATLISAHSGSEGRPLYFCILCDATADVGAARARQEDESRSKVTNESASVLVWMADAEGRCEWFNHAWLRFRGRTLGDEVGEGWAEGLHPEDLENCLGIYEASFAAREPFALDCRLRRRDGKYRWMLNTGVPRVGGDGAFLGYVGTCVDITERREQEDALAERTRVLRLSDRRREEFLARLSHELRNPLAPIANAAGILRTMERGDPNLASVREIIERQVDLLRRLVTDLVDVTRITKGDVVVQREVVALDALIERVVTRFRPEAARRGIRLQVVPVHAGLSCTGDPDLLAQALDALLANALKYSSDGATIELAATSSDDVVSIRVTDEGRGIAPELLPRVFDLFVQGPPNHARENHGLGVGLTIARKVARLHGGDVTIDSAGIGLGAEATLHLGVGSVAGDASATTIDAGDLRSVTDSRVLIIEDNDDARESLRMLVELGGNEVLTASNASEALRVAEAFAPQLVVCDLGLPDIDGWRLVQALREKLGSEQTRYVALTGFGRSEDRDRALESGFDTFLIKPLHSASS